MQIKLDLAERYQNMPKNLEFILNDKFQSGFWGGFGNGKTEALCWRGILLAILYPGTTGLIGRATYRELQDSTLRSFFSVCPPELIKDYFKQENRVVFINGSEILFRAFDDPRKLLSMNLAWFGIDQAEEVDEEIYLQLLGRLRDPRCRYAFGVGNPEPGWVKKRFKDVQDQDFFFIEATTLENPHLPGEYITNLIKNFPDFWVKRYVYGDWAAFEGQVFTEFVESQHVIDPFSIPSTWAMTYIIDYGYRNPLACLKIAVDHDDNHVVVDEHYEREQVISWHAEKLKEMGITNKSYILIDPSCSAKIREKNGIQVSIIDEFNSQGIYPIPANNEIAGILRVNQWLKEGRLKIFRSCFNTIREMQNLRWKKVRPDWNRNLPEEMEDKENHTTDSLKYYANSRTEGPARPKPSNWPMIERMERLKKIGKFKEKDWYLS